MSGKPTPRAFSCATNCTIFPQCRAPCDLVDRAANGRQRGEEAVFSEVDYLSRAVDGEPNAQLSVLIEDARERETQRVLARVDTCRARVHDKRTAAMLLVGVCRYTQGEAAAALEVSRRTICEWLRGPGKA